MELCEVTVVSHIQPCCEAVAMRLPGETSEPLCTLMLELLRGGVYLEEFVQDH
jgi:hypothetical protein